MTGTIKDYTPNFEFIIPEFNITGWHDYLEENFRSIDALFYNLFGINNYSGIWKNLTSYTTGQVLFVGDDEDYGGRLVKVLVDHTTTNDSFSTFFANNPTYYELFADASSAQIFAQEAKDWATKMNGPVKDALYSSKYYADMVNELSTEITTLYNIRNDIQSVNLISTDVINVSNIKNSVTNVANNETNINSVANNSSNIVTVSENIANVNTNATNISAINTNASNISDIQNAYSNAQSALNSKNKAQEWAISDTLVDNTDYSAKYYAEIASHLENPLRIGQIIQSTIPLIDAGLHLLDGSVVLGSGVYSDFVSYVANLYDSGNYDDIFETEANWQISVSSYGVCGKFVYDSVNNTVRLPKITGFTESTIDVTKVGDLVEAGLPNITGNVAATNWEDTSNNTGAFYTNDSNQASIANRDSYRATAAFDASRSSSIYGNSTTVQPQSIKVLYYICIATSTKTDIQVDIDEIITNLNAKADKTDLNNKIQEVSVAPVSPVTGVLYVIPES